MNASNLEQSGPPTLNNNKPIASISLDLDNQWSYMKTHGDPGWETFPSYFDIFIPHVLEILDRLKLKITFFIVGQDASLDKNKEFLRLVKEKGHEVGNHSFHHEPWLHLYSRGQIKKEISETEEQIIRVTGQKPIGFRGPGFSWSPNLIEVLAENGYIYDTSTLPTYIAPIARVYYFWRSSLTKEQKAQRNLLFGSFKDGLKSIKPFYWQLPSGGKLLEIPVTTIPVIKMPFHLSYLIYLSRLSSFLMFLYLKIGLTLCWITQTTPVFLLHPLDLLGGEQVPELAFFPGMDLSGKQKIELFEKILKELTQHFTFVKMSLHARSAIESDNIKSLPL